MNTRTVAWKFLPVLLIVLLLILSVSVALAATTGFFSPSQSATVPGTTTLTNPDFAFADDANNATGNFSSGTTLGRQYFGFGASIPAGTVLQGIEVQAQYWITGTNGTNTLEVALSTDGTNWTIVDTDTNEPQSQTSAIFQPTGNPLWGRTWTATDLTNLRVRVRMSSSSGTNKPFNLDWISVRLTYNQQPNTPTNSTPTNGATISNVNPTFTWSAFSDPDAGNTQSQFQVQLRQNPGNYTPAFRDSGAVNSSANIYTPTSWNLPDGGYCWQVRVSDNSGASNATGAYSAETCFTVNTTGSIGDLVWLDSDGDGARDVGEPGIDGVTLTLQRGLTTVGTTTTAGGGAYLFSNLTGPQQVNVLDNFGSASYSNNNGTRNWASPWSEFDNNGAGPTSGSIQIVGGQLRLSDAPDTGTEPSLAREVNLSGSTTASLSFDLSTPGTLEGSDQIVVEVSSNGGGLYTSLATFSGEGSSSPNYNITPYISANTRIRFRISSNVGANDEYFAVDNVQIQFQDTVTATAHSTAANPAFPISLSGSTPTATAMAKLTAPIPFSVPPPPTPVACMPCGVCLPATIPCWPTRMTRNCRAPSGPPARTRWPSPM
ncbi:MAG: hypothetical protein HYR94_12730 [Chloroflexi bacterium]|nr:hypothetical protein [Chloroflexota bacterium]